MTLNSRARFAVNGEPTSSTVAAQIVNNHEAATPERRAEDRDAFGHLLQEILSNPGAESPDKNLSCKLVTVMAEAGLGAVLKELRDPFVGKEQLFSQAADSVSVIELVIQKYPELLVESSGHEAPNASQGRLFLYLLPKILALFGHEQCQPLSAVLTRLLCYLVEVAFRNVDLWHYGLMFISIYQSCVRSILNALESFDGFPKPGYSLNVLLPPSESMKKLFDETEQLIALPKGYQTEVTSSYQAVNAILALVTALTSAERDFAHQLGSLAKSDVQSWASRCFIRLIKFLRTWMTDSRPRSEFGAALISLNRAFILTYKVTTTISPHVSQATLPFFHILAESLPLYSLVHPQEDVQIELARTLIVALRICEAREKSVIAFEILLPAISRLKPANGNAVGWVEDLQLVINLWINHGSAIRKTKGSTLETTPEYLLPHAPAFSDPTLVNAFSELKVSRRQGSTDINERPAKRRRLQEPLSSIYSANEYAHYLVQLTTIVHGEPRQDLTGLSDVIRSKISTLSDDQSHTALNALSHLSCAGAGCLEEVTSMKGKPRTFRCTLCDARSPLAFISALKSNVRPRSDTKDIVETILQLISYSIFLRNSTSRIFLALAIQRVVNHSSDPSVIDLATSEMGQWCLRSLQSSLRELRIASAQALPSFLRDNIPEDLRKRNCVLALDFLRTLAERQEVWQQETLIMAWGSIAKFCGEDELNIGLLRLVEYLGHPNAYICSVAYNEFYQLAESRDCSPEELMSPFWRSIAVTVVKNLNSKPQMAQNVADLIGISVNQFLVLTQTETLPYLVLKKHHNLLSRIASARGTTIRNTCTQPRKNLARILALLLLQPWPDLERTTMEFLCAAASGFSEDDIATWVQLEPVMIACEMLKAAGDEEPGKRPEVYSAIQSLAIIAMRKPGQAKSTPKQKRPTSNFLEAHVLGIMAYFSDEIDNSALPAAEKLRCIRAIEEIITLSKSAASIALPQIRACLQSALAVEKLRNQAFAAWILLLRKLEEDEIESLLQQTFAIIIRRWPTFTADSQQRAYDIVAHLFKSYRQLIKDNFQLIPSLAAIPILSKFESEISRLKEKMEVNEHFKTFAIRCKDENAAVVLQAFRELLPFLERNQRFIHETAVSQQPHGVVAELTRSTLDSLTRFAIDHMEIAILCSKCLGLIGCLDPTRIETVRRKRDMLILSNFEPAGEAVDFVAFLLENVLVGEFTSAANARAQGFLAYVMQELLQFGGFSQVAMYRPRASQPSTVYQRWMEIGESVRNTLVPFLSSKYLLVRNAPMPPEPKSRPIFSPDISHGSWLRTFVFDLLRRGKGDNAKMIFQVLLRVIRSPDITISSFLLPFATLNVILGGSTEEAVDIGREILAVLESDISKVTQAEADRVKQCSENVFHILDYLLRFMQEKKRIVGNAKMNAAKYGKPYSEVDELTDTTQISSVERVLAAIPAEVISKRAVECGSYARALFHWEQYIRQEMERSDVRPTEELYQYLQDIYSSIDEPDGLEGISSHLHVLNPDQQVLEHRKAGRWSAAQSLYNLQLVEKPGDVDIQRELLICLREAGQYESMFSYLNQFLAGSRVSEPRILSIAAEASWVTGKWQWLQDRLPGQIESGSREFDVGLGRALLALHHKDELTFSTSISALRDTLIGTTSPSTTASIQAFHDVMLKLHILYEVETISGLVEGLPMEKPSMIETLDRRLEVLGAQLPEKQYILGIRRAAMEKSSLNFTQLEVATSWLTSAQLARKANLKSAAYNAVLRAARLGDDTAKIEYSRLLWKDGHHRQAIQNLEGAIAATGFRAHDDIENIEDAGVTGPRNLPQNPAVARAHLLLGKWLERSGQTPSRTIRDTYAFALRSYRRWDKGHYYLGAHYNKIIESERVLPRARQSSSYLSGELSKIVVDQYLRSLCFGSKYYYQTLPKTLTLWLDLGMEVRNGLQRSAELDLLERRTQYLEAMNSQIKKYLDRLPAYTFYTALAQIISRLSHPNQKVFDVLSSILLKIVAAYPQQALWSLLAVAKASSPERAGRGLGLLNKLKDNVKYGKRDVAGVELRYLVTQSQKLSDQLLAACETPVEPKTSHVSLSRELGFNHKLAPCALVVPIESTLTVSLPTVQGPEHVKSHKPFPRDTVTISSFSDDVLVLSSLQRPRKISVLGSDGRTYGLLCKPKDDLRKDQRLMEFNSMINRALKRDAESSKRRLYIRTYGVTPLNEECGTIEWVDKLKPMRDIVIQLYRQKNIKIDYGELRILLAEACAEPKNLHIYTERILPHFKPVLHEWFVESFPGPDAWFTARLRFTRSCAVISIVGHILGLGDRHGENILLEEANGGVFHVDFNCLFDKGLTFDKPEVVPFRLTHNMVDSMGVHGIEGPFRKAAELTLAILQQHKESLMTILETFLYDPTTDFIGKKKRSTPGVPETPQEVLDGVHTKLRGLLRGESVPLSVEGYVEALISMARNPANLAAMYIGWCSFF